MKSQFREYYGLAPEQLEKIFADCVFVFDTNALLDLYRLDINDANVVLDIIEKNKDRVIIPYHVAEEYHNNLLDVITAVIQNADDTLSYDFEASIKNFFDNISKYSALPSTIRNKYEKRLKSLVNDFKKDITKRQELLKSCLENWEFQSKVAELLSDCMSQRLETQEIEIIKKEEGPHRYDNEVPPGYKDRKKGNENEYGDLIIWKEILSIAQKKQKSIIFITRDLKEDWMEKHHGLTCGPRKELRKEFYDVCKDNEFHIYTLTQFVNYAHESNMLSKSDMDALLNRIDEVISMDLLTKIKLPKEMYELTEDAEGGQYNSAESNEKMHDEEKNKEE